MMRSKHIADTTAHRKTSLKVIFRMMITRETQKQLQLFTQQNVTRKCRLKSETATEMFTWPIEKQLIDNPN